MAKRTKRARKQVARKAGKVRARKTVRSVKRTGATVRANSTFKQPFTVLQNGFSSLVGYFK